MELVVKVNKKGFILNYIKIFNGGLELTKTEQKYLALLLELYLNLLEEGIKEPYLSQLVFSKENTDKIKINLCLTSKGLTNYKIQLIKKGAIKEDDGACIVNPILIPKKEITFKFIVNE